MNDLERVVREGLPRDGLDALIKRIAAPSIGTASVDMRNKIVPRASYQRATRLSLQVSETTERLARLYALANSAFDNDEAVAMFLMTPHPELDGRTPFDVALTEIGGRQVEEIIERGLHGLPA